MTGVDGQRREDGEDLALEDVDQMGPVVSSSEDQSEKRTPASASSGTIWSRKMRSWRRTSSSTRVRIIFSCSPGRRPSTDLVRTPAAT